MSRVFGRYMSWLNTNPFASRLVTGTSILTAGDLISQVFIEKRVFNGSAMDKKIKLQRTAKTMMLGTLFLCPSSYLWYQKFLPKILNTNTISRFSTNAQNVFGTMADQLGYSVYSVSAF